MSSARVLVADDDDNIRALITRALSRSGMTVDAVADGREAIDALDIGPYDAVVLDLMMPRVDGLGVIEHLVDTRPDLLEKTVVLTAFPREAARERVHHLCDVISKPFDLLAVINAVRERIARRDIVQSAGEDRSAIGP